MVKSTIDRRSLLKSGAATVGFAALGGAPILGSMRHAMAQGALASEQLRTIGLSVTVQDRILQDFKKASGVGSVTGTAATYPDAQTKILSGSTDFDCWEIIEQGRADRDRVDHELGEYPQHLHDAQSEMAG
jgi:putative spermidine/putrescine transport system substrate-binding protein